MSISKKASTSEAVYHTLKDQILHLELTPGCAISEIDTAEKYMISRTPVRDAFKALEKEGLLEVRPHIGTFISLIDLNQISDVLYMREVLEKAVLHDLSSIYDKSQEFKIRLVLQRQKELLDSNLPKEELSRAFIKSDNEFHDMLFDIAGKKNIISFLRSINSQYERFRTFLNLGDKDNIIRLYEEHNAIFEAISSSKIEELDKTVSHHIYDGFNSSTQIIYQYPEFFESLNE